MTVTRRREKGKKLQNHIFCFFSLFSNVRHLRTVFSSKNTLTLRFLWLTSAKHLSVVNTTETENSPKIGFEWMKFSSILHHFAFPWKDSKEAIKGYHHFLLSLSFNGWCRTHSTRKTFLISEAYQGPNLTSHCLIFLSLLRLHAPFHFQPFLFDLSRHVTRNTAAPSSQITFCLTFYR